MSSPDLSAVPTEPMDVANGESPTEFLNSPPQVVPPPTPDEPTVTAGARSSSALRDGAGALRASVVLILLIVLLAGVVYPISVTLFAQQVTPVTANGSLIYGPNGNAIASTLIGQNITNASLFWLRPSMIDYQPFNGSGNEAPYGPTDPVLLNETLGFMRQYGLVNGSAPIDLVSVSASGLDPDITVGAAWAQIPRIAFHTDLSQAALNDFVNAHTTAPFLGIFGPAEVNVIQLDILLIHDLATNSPLNAS